MLLHRLFLKNFKRFRDEEIIFSDGITGIVGNNGAGKSSIIEAVFFALYGLKKGPGLESEYIVSAGAGPKESCEVRLDFEVGGEDFSVLRSFRRTKSSTVHQAQLNRGEALMAEGVTAVEEQVVRLLGMSAADFKNTIYAAQKDLLSLLDETPGGRRAWIMRMLGIDYLKKESDMLLRNSEVECREQLAGLEYYLKEHSTGTMHEEQARLDMEIATLQELLSITAEQKAGIDTQLDALYAGRRALEELRRRYDGLNAAIQTRCAVKERLSEEHHGLAKEINALEAMASELETLGDVPGRLEDAQKSIRVLRDKKEQYNRFCEEERRLRSTLAGLRERNVRLQRQRETLQKDAAACERLKAAMKRREAIIAELSAMRPGEEDFKRLTREIDRCDYQYTMLEGRVASVRQDLDACRSMLDETGMPDELALDLEKARHQRVQTGDRIAAISANMAALDQMFGKTAGHLEEIRLAGQEGSCPTCRRPLGGSYEKVIADLEAQLTALESEKESLGRERFGLVAEFESMDERVNRVQTLLQQSQEAVRCRESLLGDRAQLLTAVDTCLNRREEMALALRHLGYDPAAAAALQVETESLEAPWREFLGAQERLKGRKMIEEEYERVAGEESTVLEEISRLEKVLSELVFDEAAYIEAERSLERLIDTHRRFITLAARAEQLPLLFGRLATNENETAGVEREIAAFRGELQALAYDPARAEELEAAVEVQKDTRDRLISRISKTQADLGGLERKHADLAAKIAENNRREERRAVLEEELALLAMTRTVIAEFLNYLLNAVRSGIESELGRILGQITDGRYENVLIGEDFTVLVEDLGEHYPVNRFSGGEQDDIAIALRIALSRYLAEFHGVHDRTFLIFDEIFGSQDEERRNNLIQALRTQENQFPQIFLISHIPEIQGEFSNTLQVVMESGLSSRVREVTM